MQGNIKKVILISQLIRSNDCLEVMWVYNLFNYYISRTTQLPVYALLPPNSKLNSADYSMEFDIDKFYSFYGIENFSCLPEKSRYELWAKIYFNNEYNQQAYEYVYSIFKDSLVVVHELEHIIVNILEYYNIPYIDFNTDPIRYLDDQLLSFRSNVEAIYNQLLKYKVEEEVFYQYANYIKSANFAYAKDYSQGNAVLFIGQTDCDKTLIDISSKNLYSILEHKEEFKTSISGYDRVYYKRHPMVKNDEDIIEFIKTLADVEIIDDNFYKLMCRADIKKVVSISSGTCIEAKYFGKQTQTLLRESILLQYENTFEKEKYISIYNDFFKLSFWSKILNPVVNTIEFKEDIGFFDYHNKLRNSRGIKCYWGYEDLNQETAKFDAMQNASALIDVQQSYWIPHVSSIEQKIITLEQVITQTQAQMQAQMQEYKSSSFLKNVCKTIKLIKIIYF